jgi:hypothetical protein
VLEDSVITVAPFLDAGARIEARMRAPVVIVMSGLGRPTVLPETPE